MISVQIEGGKELEEKLLQLERNVGKKIIRQAVRNAQKSLIPAIKSNLAAISRGGGMAEKIARALKLGVPKKQKKGGYTIQVLLKQDPAFVSYRKGSFSYLYNKKGKGHGKEIGRSYIPAAIEYGHGHNKEQAARPFIRPAADATEKSRVKILADYVKAELEKIWSKK
jgi:hypothetical protein